MNLVQTNKYNAADDIRSNPEALKAIGDKTWKIYGPPGTGKTELAKLIGKIFSKLGILKKDIFRKVTRSDLIALFRTNSYKD